MARTGMTDLIQAVRDLAAAGTADYSVGGTSYWTADQVQNALDVHRSDFYQERYSPVKETDSGGTARYYDYHLPYEYLEETTGGTAIFAVQETDGTYLGTAAYSVDYRRGVVSFSSDTAGSALMFTGRTYDPWATAADIWEMKAGHVADRFDFTADGASFKLSQRVQQYMAQARRLRNLSPSGGVSTHEMVRGDLVLG